VEVLIVGGGLAGCEAAFQLAERGIDVRLCEMKPEKRTPAQTGDKLCELVCSNSLRGASLSNAVGLLKEEMRRMGSLIVSVADLTQVPAGGALAVDRDRFSDEITRRLKAHPRITIETREVTSLPEERPCILATGPLTTDGLAADLARVIGAEHLAYYDAIAPIVAADSIDWSKVWKQSRYDKGDEAAYVNCPFEEAEYEAFVKALVESEKTPAREFEQVRYFEGCLPCEVMAERGLDTLRYGPMKPVGLTNPHTGKRAHAVLQLRAEDAAATAYNLVGFQTRMKYPEQNRVFRMIPGLEQAEFLRLGSVHRNTFVDAPRVLNAPTMEVKNAPGLFLAGQVSGVEGYVESAAGGFLCAYFLARRLNDQPLHPPPATTAFGGLLTHLARESDRYQPSNITWACVPPLEGPRDKKLKKIARYEKLAERALQDLETWKQGR
jgi:methylenetetrahydrofolate--tRNA-(uracil-5-)-methyltransferase